MTLYMLGYKRVEIRLNLEIKDWDAEGECWVIKSAKIADASMMISAEQLLSGDVDVMGMARERLHREGAVLLEKLLGVEDRDKIHQRFRELVRLWPVDRPFPYQVMSD